LDKYDLSASKVQDHNLNPYFSPESILETKMLPNISSSSMTATSSIFDELSEAEVKTFMLIQSDPIYMESIANMQQMASKLFPAIIPNRDEILKILTLAFMEMDDKFNLQQAIDFGGDFVIPRDVITENDELFARCNYDLSIFARTIQNRYLKNRFNMERVNAWDQTDPLIHLLRWMADDGGIPVILDDDFKPNHYLGPPKMSKIYEHGAHAVVNLSILKQCQAGVCAVLSHSMYELLPEDSHDNQQRWTLKPKKVEGRPIIDLSNQPTNGGDSINTEALKAKVIEILGGINYPNIINYAVMIWEVGLKEGFENLIFFKTDIVAAYTQLYIHPDSVKYLCTWLTDGISINLAMVFGGVQFPYAWNIISQSLQFAYNKLLIGRALIYSDDTGLICNVKNLNHDKEKIREIQTSLMGPFCIESDPLKSKDMEGRVIEFIGYTIDLNSLHISLSKRNGNRTLYSFFSIDLTANCDVKSMQCLGSLAERTSLLFNFMKPFVQELHNFGAYAARQNRPVALTGGAKFVISLWRIVLILMKLEPDIFTAKLESFIFKSSRIAIKHDACPTGISFAIYEIINGEYHNLCLNRFCGADIRRYKMKGNSSCQNTVEFISMTMGLVVLAMLGIRNTPVFVIGDSTTSLSWAERRQFKSILCQRAAILFAILGLHSKNYVNDTEWIPGIENVNEDAMSRLFEVLPSEIPEAYKPYPEKRIFIEGNEVLNKCLNWCNPNADSLFLSNGTMSDMDAFCAINAMIESICE